MRYCSVQFLGRVPYATAHNLQEQLVASVKAGQASETVLLLEHPHVITLGRSANRSNIITSRRDVDIFETGRGGDVTYHGPGQLVGYPIINLAPDRCDIRRYVRDLEEVLIRVAADYGISAERVPGLTGVWVGSEKLAAIGVRISRWVTMHGFAFNVSTDLRFFDLIVPCGITDRGVTSLERLLGRNVALDEVARVAANHFGIVFDREIDLKICRADSESHLQLKS